MCPPHLSLIIWGIPFKIAQTLFISLDTFPSLLVNIGDTTSVPFTKLLSPFAFQLVSLKEFFINSLLSFSLPSVSISIPIVMFGGRLIFDSVVNILNFSISFCSKSRLFSQSCIKFMSPLAKINSTVVDLSSLMNSISVMHFFIYSLSWVNLIRSITPFCPIPNFFLSIIHFFTYSISCVAFIKSTIP